MMPLDVARAQDTTAAQEIKGSLAPGQYDIYLLEGLKQGQALSAFMENTSGNLDPFLSILPGGEDIPEMLASYKEALDELVVTTANPILELPALRDQYTLAWDDDSGPGYSAALEFTIPKDGDYYLLAGSSLAAGGRQTAGNYRLQVGVDAPQVLTGTAVSSGAVIAVPTQVAQETQLIQEFSNSLNENHPSTKIALNDINPGDTLYIYLETTSGDLKPIILLKDYSRKPVGAANLEGTSSTISLQQAFPEGGANYFLDILAASPSGQQTSGDFRLLVGVNAPQVLEGQGQPNSESLLKLSIPVEVGFKLQQIVNIDQPDEILNAVGTIKLEWTDPALAYNPDDCQCYTRLYTENSYNQFLDDVKGKWPVFTLFNQQGNRWTQNRLIEIEPNGHVTYLERLSTDFQVDFDWTKYPFDKQDFYIRVDMLYSEDYYRFAPMEGFNEIDPMHGEDEFVLTDFDTEISSEISNQQLPTSRFTFHFSAPRNLSYYTFRIFIPILLIISVSYITFFMKDYTRRIEIATGNLLLFIAFSFSLGENYPRMGYLTFLDAIMAITFIINTLVVALNVYYKWLENQGEQEKADRLETPMNYLYPLAYFVSFGIAALIFLE